MGLNPRDVAACPLRAGLLGNAAVKRQQILSRFRRVGDATCYARSS
jgi:hypothetical protein